MTIGIALVHYAVHVYPESPRRQTAGAQTCVVHPVARSEGVIGTCNPVIADHRAPPRRSCSAGVLDWTRCGYPATDRLQTRPSLPLVPVIFGAEKRFG